MKKNESWLYHRVSTIYILYVWISQGLRLPSTASTFPGQISVRKKRSTPDIPWWTWIAPHLCPRCACQRWKVVMPGASGFWWRRCFLLRCFGWWDSFGDVFLIFVRVIFFLVKTRDVEWWASGTRMWIWQLGCYIGRYWTLLERNSSGHCRSFSSDSVSHKSINIYIPYSLLIMSIRFIHHVFVFGATRCAPSCVSPGHRLVQKTCLWNIRPKTPPKDRCPNHTSPAFAWRSADVRAPVLLGRCRSWQLSVAMDPKNPVIIGGAKEVARYFHVFSYAKWEAKFEPQNLQNHRVVRVVMLNHFNNFMNVDSVNLKEYLSIPQKSGPPIFFLDTLLLIWENSPNYCWWTKSCTTKDDDYPSIYRVLTFNHPRWCRFLSINSSTTTTTTISRSPGQRCAIKKQGDAMLEKGGLKDLKKKTSDIITWNPKNIPKQQFSI